MNLRPGSIRVSGKGRRRWKTVTAAALVGFERPRERALLVHGSLVCEGRPAGGQSWMCHVLVALFWSRYRVCAKGD